jgi:hypothetical protein
MRRWLTDTEISAMAHAWLNTFEFTGDELAASRAASEYCLEELRIRPTDQQIGYARKLGRVLWNETVIQVKREMTQ